MPAVSQKQRAYLNARFGHAWVKRHHFDNTGELPARAPRRAKKKSSSARRDLYARFQRKHG